ncbi:peptide chain release factor H [Litoribacillus peritrichatus]|uniref:Peptide chain release factor H n=1 Tax=Litoribacillus peritrichatus TaxID=718191 RepID=A0ABP7N0F0_9GAMM
MLLIQLSSGQGPEECCLAVANALKLLLKEMADVGLDANILEYEPGRSSVTYKSVLVAIKPLGTMDDASVTDDIKSRVYQHWNGTLKWVCKSPYRPKHGRKNWFLNASVWEPKASAHLASSDFRIKTCRAGGSGGQHVNTTDSAVQITHKASGLSVKVQTERSQHQNKKIAWQLIRYKLEQEALAKQQLARGELRMQHHQLIRGHAVRTFKGNNFIEV